MTILALRCFLAIVLVLAVTPARSDIGLPDGEGKQLTMRVCGNCHGLKVITSLRLSKSQWSREVDKMAQVGAAATDEEFDVIINYLARNFGGKLNVNSASAAQIGEFLEVSGSEAEAIIRYRHANGNFRNLDDVEKVPGINVKKIEANRNRLTF